MGSKMTDDFQLSFWETLSMTEKDTALEELIIGYLWGLEEPLDSKILELIAEKCSSALKEL